MTFVPAMGVAVRVAVRVGVLVAPLIGVDVRVGVLVGAAAPKIEYNKTFGEPVPGLVTLLAVPLLTSALRTVAADADGLLCKYNAATPTTCGVAIEVPLMVAVAVLLEMPADVMDEPGAKISKHVPQLEYDARASVLVVAPTVMPSAVRDGELLQASAFSLPAARPYTTPALIELRTAVSSADDTPPPKLMLATAGLTRFAVTQSTPAMTPES